LPLSTLITGRVWTVVLETGEQEGIGLAPRPAATRRRAAEAMLARTQALSRTLEVAQALSPARQVITLLGGDLQAAAPSSAAGVRALHRPDGLASGAAVFLGLSIARALDPNSSVVILPTDHLPAPAEALARSVRNKLVAAAVLSRLVLLGRTPQEVEDAHAWICPGDHLDDRAAGCPVDRVSALVDPPPAFVARALERTGALWDTMVSVGPLDRLWTLGRAHMPDVMERLDPLVRAVGTSREGREFETVAEQLPQRSLAFDLLRPARDALGVVRLNHDMSIQPRRRAVDADSIPTSL